VVVVSAQLLVFADNGVQFEAARKQG